MNKTPAEINELAKQSELLAASLIDSIILRLPEGISNGSTRKIVEAIVTAAVLRVTANQAEAAAAIRAELEKESNP
mgnify:FL=1